MTKKVLTIILLSAIFMTSCNNVSKQEATHTETVENANEDIINISSTDNNGHNLEVSFNNTKGTATIQFNGETSELIQEKSASGFWYKNETFELRGKGNDMELKKDGNLVFEHHDEWVSSSLTNKEGQTLKIEFNNTTNQAKVYLDGGDQIDLQGQKSGSGIWYKNDHYELRGKGEAIELTKDGVSIFKN
ncbi:MAG TPA: MliC family protein [Edaphocola sp.]|nr:MliC family protein [Edaphocola sp.]